MTKKEYTFNFGGNRKGKIKHEKCFKGELDDADKGVYAWTDHLGNILGFARDDGTPNHLGSYVSQ